ncbi:hypothetical protein NL491_27905, partial [Klebsiella pneumoniae]|nr:hypothetical protein [Klebsiella pneumoniae]
YIGETSTATLALAARWWRAAEVAIVPELDSDLERQPEAWVLLRPDASEPGVIRVAHELTLAPRRRGAPQVRAVHLRWRGPLGLIE